ncbi:hypothetical protein ED236_00410 [Pseudomethylobacillus aquaticus]|uniref:Uncharacterized protein n=1 Tax=Pseudomethylobacillus aquaticus TaxID=2676064 RepID=A0A3N0V5A5_9PROT|nr:hypothetical protein [Pseudomethylobacillus aquaticus]ROH87990.1 hypothetical protein ED236_00410 [Pseudomethylobacillus aquaticus]
MLELLQLDVTGSMHAESDTHSRIIVTCLQNPCTINELYRRLPEISPEIIAPLVANMHRDGKIFAIGSRVAPTSQGINRRQTVWSSRNVDKPQDKMTISFAHLASVFCSSPDPEKRFQDCNKHVRVHRTE